jgi:hypothetical protein
MIISGVDVKTSGRFLRRGAPHADGFSVLENPHDVIAEARKRSLPIDVFTFVQTLANTERLFGYHMELDNFAALPVQTFENWWTGTIDNKTRNMVRKAEKKGVVVREAPFDRAFVQGISDIYNETPVRQGKKFWHYGKSLETIERENGTLRDQSVYIGAYFEDRLIGFVKLVIDRAGGQAGMMQILSTIQDRDKAPTNALIAQAVRSCAQRMIPFLVYAHFSYGQKQHDSLVTFKSSNGFQRVEVPRYYIPLTVRGQWAIRVGLHHHLSERVPEPMLATYRELRSYWYTRRVSRHAGG